jgi:hypothetical protein
MRAHKFVKGFALAAALAVTTGWGRVTATEGGLPAVAHPFVVSAAGVGTVFVTSPPPAIGTAKFAFLALQHESGSAGGYFRMVRQRAGFNVDFIGAVTCIAHDPATNRAWIGGVVLANFSNDPNHTLEIHAPGQDVWFRVVDNQGAAPDRSTVYGFKGAAGVNTSAEYCALKLWPAGDANTFEVTIGDIQVRSH